MAALSFDRDTEALIHAALRQYRGHPDWDDLVQEARIAVWRAQQRVVGCAFSTLVWKASLWAARRWLKRRAMREQWEVPKAVEEYGLPPQENWEQEAARDLLTRLFAASRGREWEAIRLRFFEGLSESEAADRLGIARGAVSARVRAALKRHRVAEGADERAGRRIRPAPPNGNREKTHCPRGHPYSGTNLGVSAGHRHCRACRNAATKAWQARKK